MLASDLKRNPRTLSETAWFLVGKLDERSSVCHVPINASPFSVGRRPDCTLCLPFPTVSGKHAEIVVNSDKLILEDQGSTNGTYLNGDRVERPTALKQDDLIQFADVALRV